VLLELELLVSVFGAGSLQLSDLSPSMSIMIFSIFSISILILSSLLSQLHGGVGGLGIGEILQGGLGSGETVVHEVVLLWVWLWVHVVLVAVVLV
jgi:hypothetical protein